MEDHHHHHRHHHHQHHHHHHHQQHQHQHQHHFGVNNDLRQVVNGPRTSHNAFLSMPPHPTTDLFPGHRNLSPLPTPQHHQQHYEVMMFGRDIMPPSLHDFTSTPHDSAAAAAAAAAATMTLPTPPTFDAEGAGCIGGDPSTGRWPRQETLTLLEIRSRLDPKFKEANHKGPLWDEVSRIMSEEHGYQRSGKKCREKFENLYKYYKKTKDGKAGRHDGKHYRFFRQLEALYGENSSTVSVPETNVVGSIHFQASSHDPSQTNQDKFQSHNSKHCDSLSLTNSTNFDTTSSDDDNDHHSMENESIEKRRKRNSGRSWKVKIKDFIDSQMRKLVEKQKEWLDKLVKTLEEKEKERMLREEEWRKQEANRLEREQKFWAKERAWIEARDAALMEALQKLTGREIMKPETPNDGINVTAAEVQNHSENQNNEDESEILNSCNVIRGGDRWPESEITRLQQLRAEIETRFPCREISEEVSWEVVATKMACFGYERSALMCKEKWESMSKYPRENEKEGSKKCKENTRNCFFFKNNDDHRQSSLYDQGSAYCDDINDQGKEIERLQTNNSSSPSKSNAGNVDPSDSCFPFLMSSEGGNLWENYGLKLNKENQNH